MDTSNAILELRKWKGLSQEDFAQRLSVTRQAVSRWETGETVPTTDNLKLIAETFDVTVDYLLGLPSAFCQSCGMILSKDTDRGSEADGSPSQDYCCYCYQHGAFTEDLSVDEMIEHNLRNLDGTKASHTPSLAVCQGGDRGLQDQGAASLSWFSI